MESSLRRSAMLMAIGALVLQSLLIPESFSQQRVPRGTANGEWNSPSNLDREMQKTPRMEEKDRIWGSTPPGTMPPPTLDYTCSLPGVDSAELDAVRRAIIEMLSSDATAAKGFAMNEQKLRKDCPREKATYYLRAIAKIKSQR